MFHKLKLSFFLVFFSSISFSQNFEIKEIEKLTTNSPNSHLTSIGLNNKGYLYYNLPNAIIENYGNYQKLHEVLPEHLKTGSLARARKIECDVNGGIYFSYFGGIHYLNTLTNERKLIWKPSQIMMNNQARFRFTIDKNGDIWVLYEEKSVSKLLNISQNQFYRFNTPLDRKMGLGRNSFKIYRNENESVLVFGKMIFFSDERKKLFNLIYKSDAKKILSPLLIEEKENFLENSKKSKPYKSYDDLFTDNIKNIHFLKVPGKQPINIYNNNFTINGERIHVISLRENEILFHSVNERRQNSLLNLVHKFTHKSEILELKIHERKIIFLDRQNKIFELSNYENGFHKHQFNLASSTRGIVTDTDKNIYVNLVRNFGEVVKISPNGKETKIVSASDFNVTLSDFYNLEIENDSILWVFRRQLPLIKHNLKTNKSKTINYPEFDGRIRTYINHNKDEILFPSKEGLVLFNKRKETFKPYASFNITRIINKILKIESKIWIATEGKGLYVFDENTKKLDHFTTKSEKLKLSSNFIFDLYINNKNELFIGSNEGLDILNLKTDQIQNYSQANGLPDNRVVSIIEGENNYWLGTFSGLSRFNKNRASFENYFVKDGLPDNEFNKASAHRANDSLFVFGGMNGIVKFNPFKIIPKNESSQLRVVNLEYFKSSENKIIQKKYNFDKLGVITLPYDKNFIKINFTDGNNGNILYKVDNSNWLPSKKGEINLVGLEAGNHDIYVKVKGLNQEPRKYQIFVETVLYKKLWIQIIIFLTAVILVSSYFIGKNKKEKRNRKRDLEIKRLEDVALRYQMSPHFIKNALNNIQSTLFLNGEKTASKYISNLATIIRFTLYNAGKDRVSLKEELNYLSAYISMEHLRYDGQFDYEITTEGISDVDKIEFPPMLFQPIVENAILHGFSGYKGEKMLEVKFSKQGNYIHGDILDNGRGLSLVQDVSSDKHKLGATKIIKQRIQIYNEKRSDYLSYEIARIKNKTIATIKILIIKPDEL